jgi:hypothetical protein
MIRYKDMTLDITTQKALLSANLKEVAKRLNKSIIDVTRDEFITFSPYGKRVVGNLFGTFTAFKKLTHQDQNPDLFANVPCDCYDDPEESVKASPKISPISYVESENGETATLESRSEIIKTLDDLIRVCEIDLSKWDITHYVANKWDNVAKVTSIVDGERVEEMKRTPLFQIKANLTRKNAINNLDSILEKWKPAGYVAPPIKKVDGRTGRVFCPVLSDLHIGSSSSGAYMFNRADWNTEKTVECVKTFTHKIIQDSRSRGKFDSASVICLGDLLHSINGKTSKGTQLKFDYIGEEQFDYAMSVLTYFFTAMIDEFQKVEVKATFGNHAYEVEMALFKALEAYFRTDNRIVFDLFKTRPSSFLIKDSIFMVEHGSDAEYKHAVVPKGPKRETHIQSLFLVDPKDKDAKYRYFLMGHEHHWQHHEYNNFELIVFGTTLGGDEYAAAHNWRNRSRQSCLIVDEYGVSDVMHTFFT